MYQAQFTVSTQGRGTHEITDAVGTQVAASGVDVGLCNVFIHHTSASLMICENADPSVRRDLNRFMARLVPDGDPMFEHDAEGPDDMPAHVRSVLTQSALTVPVTAGRLGLGTWQGIYVWEHRACGARRSITVTVVG
ncbi:secondary thiamine-phosphate synthase [Alkalilimnicola ehrlichii]|uniref:Secondary thiamine-phosphate synthase n=1 Tax=Alkalilimnicola ehrlichii TaxID=351052 RepID=A0A3E0WPR4_9GAMM|nr:secondary thiamine-phosphate synthase enzyme YjbQ [Alkalilimnicola ehrlichii]RFA28211.1 secondary thiamine-phosphate synthase [Alkalilimnicola ehrlichii]RFA34808.1 secondary thiamine-phosphate synthase [Alkalilimnicola ehrlichii]